MRFYKKLLLGLLGVALIFSVFAVQNNRARAGFPTSELASLPTMVKWVWDKRNVILERIQDIAINDLLQRNVAMYMDNLAYNMATQLGTGAPGQKKLVEVRDWKQVTKKANEAVAGNLIGEISELGFDGLGLNLCDPSIKNTQFKLTIPLYLIDSKAPPKPKCDWNNVVNNWKDFDAGLQDDLLVLHLKPTYKDLPDGDRVNQNDGTGSAWENYLDFWDGFSYSQSDFGVIMELANELRNREEEEAAAQEKAIESCNRYKDKTKPITKEVITTCTQIASLIDAQAKANIEAAQEKASGNVAPDTTDNAYIKILKDAANRFVNTYSSRLMKEWFTGGVFSAGTNQIRDGARYVSNYFSGGDLEKTSQTGVDWDAYREGLLDMLRSGDVAGSEYDPSAKRIERSNIATEIVQVTNFNLLENYALCPNEDEFRHPDNCTISTGFLTAANSNLTVGEAISQGILSGDLSFRNPNDDLNKSDDCYLDSLCHRNLVKLRKANIIPVGWEMAAQRSPITSPVTLKQAIDCFEDFTDGSSNCTFSTSTAYMVDGVAHNPFYHLVDPNWVLKVPAATCEALAYSSVLESGDSTNRQQYCADVKTCLREDKNGNCIEGNYGYCTKSENTWKFNGEVCEEGELFSGCLSFSNKDIGNVSYIEETLDYCTSDEVGCKRYSQEINEENDWVFDDVADDDNDLFLSSIVDCPSNEAGCSEYIVMAADTGANLIPNGDFEIWNDTSSGPDGFTGTATVTSTGGVDGGIAVLALYSSPAPPHDITCYEDIVLVPNTNYTVSVDVKINPDAPGAGPARIALSNCIDVNGDFGNVSSPDDSMTAENDDDDFPGEFLPNESNLLVPTTALSDSQYTRIQGTFNSGNSVMCGSLCIGSSYGQPGPEEPHFFDNLKMEIVSTPRPQTRFSDYGDGSRVYLNEDTFMCSAEEVGCMGYRPSNGDPMVPAVIDSGDLCPTECVGYASFAEELTFFDVVEGALPGDIEYHNFIPKTAQACPLQEVGCEEFTNLDEVAEGGEGTEYYSFLRQCVLDDHPDAKVYFTWEGTDTSGYQLKRWVALASSVVDYNAPGYAEDETAPCTNVVYNDILEAYECADNDPGVWDQTNMATCGDATPDTILDDPEFEPNCREFIDTEGNSFYRLQDKVVFASNDCQDFRRTLTGQVYRALPELSASCSAANNGCRLYVGDTDNNKRNVFSDNFENGSFSPWTASSGNIELSVESLSRDGHSMKGNVGQEFDRPFIDDGFKANREYEVSFWMKSNAFLDIVQSTIVVETASSGDFDLVIDNGSDFENIEANNWHKYKSSIYIDEDDIGGDVDDVTAVYVRLHPQNATSLGNAFFDNVILKEVIDNNSVIKNSWNTPFSCDNPYSGYHLGCQSYIDINNNEYNLKSFNYLCREEAIGCLPVIDTHNSSYPFKKVYHSSCSDGASETEPECTANLGTWELDVSQITVPADNITYLVPARENYCAVNYKGCQALGLQDRDDPTSSNTVYKINDPDTYETSLCYEDSLNCSAFDSDKGAYYFRDPGYNTCTYKKDLNIDDYIVSGWFSDSSIDEESGIPFGCSDDSVPPSWYDAGGAFQFSDLDAHPDIARTCPSDKSLCTGFRDLNDPAGCDQTVRGDQEGVCSDIAYDSKSQCEINGETWTPACTVYYYYNNDSLNEGDCNGQVDAAGGCMLLYEENYWNAEHTEVVTLYDGNQTYYQNAYLGRPISPIVCGDFDPLCELDANRLISVKQDRQCAEWLACKSSSVVWDKNTKNYRVICDEVGACDEYSDDNNVTSCGHWVNIDDEDKIPLSIEQYQSRSTGPNNHITWNDHEFTGYSVPNMLPVSELTTHDFSDENESSDTRLVYGYHNQESGPDRYHTDCVDPGDVDITEPYDGDRCQGEIGTEDFLGECDEGLCWVVPAGGETATSTYTQQTRGYATIDAPFPKYIQPDTNRAPGYSAANICLSSEESTDNNCEENYVKVTYGNGGSARYYPENNDDVMKGICLSGKVGVLYVDDDGVPYEQECTVRKQSVCDTEVYRDNEPTGEYRQDGMCQEKTKIESVNNWSGVCLDYDYSTEIIGKNGEKDYYCNLWYPVNKIQGANSLYNNYKEAGYYDENGNDRLFCSIAEPYVLTHDRIYCGARDIRGDSEVCTVLIRVPAGSRVHLGAATSDYGDLLNYGYLKTSINSGEEVFLVVPRDESPTSTDPLDFEGHPSAPDYMDYESIADDQKPRTYFERIERTRLPINKNDKPGQLFSLDDFVLPTDGDIVIDRIPVIPPDVLPTIFDANATYYFTDENVRYNSTYHADGKVLDPVYGFKAKWGPEYDLSPQPTNWTCDSAASAGGGHQIRITTPGGAYHGIYTKPGGGNQGATGGTYKCQSTGFMGWGDGKYCRYVYCNPLDHTYYVEAELHPDLAPQLCTETDCNDGVLDSDGVMTGRNCLDNLDDTLALPNPEYPAGATYPIYYADTLANTTFGSSTLIGDMTDESECEGDHNCEYIYCMESRDSDYQALNDAGQLYCSAFGRINGFEFTVDELDIMGDIINQWTFTNVESIEPCLDRIFNIEERSVFDHPQIDSGDNLVLPNPGGLYMRAVPKEGVNQDLTRQIFGYATWNGHQWIKQFPGCLAELVYDTDGVMPGDLDDRARECAPTSDQIVDWCRWTWSWGGPRTVNCYYYPQEIVGTPCDTLNGCYYQCGVVTELDADGDNSWVRTDIWWRSAEADEGRMQPVNDVDGVGSPWRTKYYDPSAGDYSDYSLNTNYYYIEGIDRIFSHFGAAIGSADDGLAVVKVDHESNSELGHTAAYTFFYDTTTQPLPIEAWNDQSDLFNVDAAQNLVWLFGRAYNFQWNSSTAQYEDPETIPGSNIPHIYDLHGELGSFYPTYSIANPVMGDDYEPRIFKVCPEGYCDVVDEVTEEFLYHAEGFTINNQALPSSGDFVHVIGRGGNLFAAIKFYYHAHPDHMPVRNIAVDWGDGVTSDLEWNNSPGKYKNSLVECDEEASLPKVDGVATTTQGFAGLDRACREGYTVLYHTYEYDEYHPCNGAPWEPPVAVGEEASCYRPRILVQDNFDQGTGEIFDGGVAVYKD